MGPTGIPRLSNRSKRYHRWWGVNVNLAGLMLEEVKLRYGKDIADVRDVEEENGDA
jgi:hypothetical protein